MEKENEYYATGKRKSAIARTWLRPGKGDIFINDRHVDEYQSLLVANKIDLVDERVISTNEGKEMAKKLGMDYIEASVMLDKNVNEAFEHISTRICESFV